MNGIRWALVLTTSERYFTLVVNFATIAVVSRLLTPSEIGVSVVGTSIATLAFSAREFAAATFLIQQPSLTREDVRGAFTVMLLLSGLISGAVALLAPWAAALYEEARLSIYLWIVAITFIVELVSIPIVALLKRDMQFQKVAIINGTNAILLATSTICLVRMGHSYMSFAWAGLLATICCGLLALCLRPDLWIYRPLFTHWRAMLRFGGYNGASVLLYRIFELLPYVMLGRILSLDAAALYGRALMLCQIPDKAILGGAVSVILPALSQEVRAARSLKVPYLRAVEYITGLQWPALLVLAVLADPAVRILLGSQWLEAIPIGQIMAVAWLFSFTAVLNYPVLLAMNAMRDAFFRALIAWPISAIIITAAAYFGLKAVALSFFIVIPFQAYVSFSFVRRRIAMTWSDIAHSLRKSAIVAIMSIMGPAAMMGLVDNSESSPIALAIIGGLLAGIGWLAGLSMTRHPILDEIMRATEAVRARYMGKRAINSRW